MWLRFKVKQKGVFKTLLNVHDGSFLQNFFRKKTL